MKISTINAREILDSRGYPTIEVDVRLANGCMGRFSVPSGASTGSREALELRDHDETRFQGKGVRNAIKNVNAIIAPALVSMAAADQTEIDAKLVSLDGTNNKSKLGANAILGVSIAYARACASSRALPLFQYLSGEPCTTMPVPLINVINGGKHADNELAIQEFMIVPKGASSFRESLQFGAAVIAKLKERLISLGHFTGVGDEGGFAPNLKETKEALDLLMFAIDASGLRAGKDVFLALDVAASELFSIPKGGYILERSEAWSSNKLVDYYIDISRSYPIISIEDGLGEHDWEGWRNLTEKLGSSIQLVGDDIFVTNVEILKRGIDSRIANAILIKPNQIGTLTETFQAIDLAKKSGYNAIMSHRSGETEDSTIADLAVAKGLNQIKTGSLCRSERLAKYNQLLRIEEILGGSVIYAGVNDENS